jgi:SpoVK/Ycf46/Vps4 family AAA+-type ATPase
MHTRYDKNREADENIKSDFIGYEGVDKDLLKEVIANQYTQADICEIIEKALLLNDTVTNDSLKYSLQELKDSKDAIKKCNFKGEDPRNGYGEDMNVPTLNRTIEQDARRYANRA